MRNLQILVPNILCFRLHGRHKIFPGFIQHNSVTRILRIQQSLIAIARKLRVNREPDKSGTVCWNLDRIFYPVRRPRNCCHIILVLLRRQHIFQDRTELDFTHNTAGLYIGQNPLQIADTFGQRLHLAKAFIHLFQTLTDLLKRLTQPLIQRRLKFLIHGLTHLFQLLRIVRTNSFQLVRNSRPNPLQILTGHLHELSGRRIRLRNHLRHSVQLARGLRQQPEHIIIQTAILLRAVFQYQQVRLYRLRQSLHLFRRYR